MALFPKRVGTGKNRDNSFIKRTIAMFAVQMILLSAVLLGGAAAIYNGAAGNMKLMLSDFAKIYGNELDYKLENGDRLLEQLIYNNTDYIMLQSGSESKRYYASINLRHMLDESLISDDYVDVVAVAEDIYQTYLQEARENVSSEEKQGIREFVFDYAEEATDVAAWRVETIGGSPFIYKIYTWKGRAAGVFMKVERFMDIASEEDLERISIYLADSEGTILSCGGAGIESEVGVKIEDAEDQWLGSYGECYVLREEGMRLYAFNHSFGLRSQMKAGWMLVLLIVCILFFFSILLVRYTRKEIFIPMTHMQESMERIQEGDYNLRVKEEYHNREFSLLKDTFNQLMDEIMGLKIKSYEKKLELQETELKCVRLQIRPHFFLNALTTISSLSMQGKDGEIKRYIEALSKNIRYMFQSGLHTVPLEEEIEHVKNYFEMQELKYPGCVFYYIDMEPKTEKWDIPQMLIHTIIENEYKYAVSLDGVLTILIHIHLAEWDGEELLSIEIEDDGCGYPKEVIEAVNEGKDSQAKDGSRIGLSSIRRMLELMYDREGLFEISDVLPHGCLNRFWIPSKTVHEIRREAM